MAPLTNAERQKKYREKLRTENLGKYEEIKKKNAERNKKRKKINECSEKLQDLKRKQWRATQQRCRMKKKNSDDSLTSNRDDDTLNTDRLNTDRVNMSLVRKLQRRLVSQRKLYDEKIKKMMREMQSLKRKCKRYMQKNRAMISLVDELKSKATEPCESQIAAQEENKTNLQLNIIQDENEMTPLSKSNSFIEQNLPHVAEENKLLVKKQLLTHYVLVNAIQDTYENTKKNSERNILKRIVENKCITRYNKKSMITRSVLGLKGSIRQRKIITKNNSIVSEIIKFYNRDDVSRATAGKKEFKTQGKMKKQRRYLLDTLKELYKKYRAEGGSAKLTCFKKYRPYYVIPPKLTDRETCGCVKHENVIMKIKKLASLGIIETASLNDILSMVVCNLDSKACAYGECLTCCNKCIEFKEDTWDMNEIVTWNEFVTEEHEYINKNGKMATTKKIVKKEVREKLKALTESFNEDLKMMKKHVFNIKHQYVQYLSCITNLKLNEVAIHIDFSENYLCKLSTEVQSMHFGASKVQVTLHTGVLYVKGKTPQSFASISACNDHGPEAIWGHLKAILNYVKTEYPLINAVHFFSDGPATQYKQKKNFFLFTNYVTDMGFPYSTWNFSEAGHGKGAADGVGGALKRRLDDLVKHGTDIPDAHTAYTLIKNSDSSVMVFYIREADIAENSIEEDLTPVPQTMTLHQICNDVTSNKTNVIRYRCLSCFCDAPQRGYCECFDVKNHCLVKTFTKENKNQTSQSFLKRKTAEDDTSQIDKGKKKTKVTVLSEIRYRAENVGYDNLQNYKPFKLKGMKKISKDFDLTNSGKENIDYDNPVPSTSGTRNKHIIKLRTVKETQGKKHVKRNSNDSSTEEDDRFSLHDSSEYDFYDELLSDTTVEENNKINKKNTNIVTEEKKDDCDFTSTSTTDEVKNANGNETDENNILPENVEKEDYNIIMITNTSTAEQEVENTDVINANKNEDCNFTHFSIADMEENNKNITEADNNNETKKIPYNIYDSVIVRYFLKNKWKYYIGFIEKIDHKEASDIII